VVHLAELLPKETELMEQFARSPIQFQNRQLGFAENQPIFRDWYQNVEKELNVQWQVDPETLGAE
jgi:hypothetical protein